MNVAEILKQHPEITNEFGRQLLDVGGQLVAGEVDDLLAQWRAAGEPFPQWTELEQATAVLRNAARHDSLLPEIEEALKRLAVIVSGAVITQLVSGYLGGGK